MNIQQELSHKKRYQPRREAEARRLLGENVWHNLALRPRLSVHVLGLLLLLLAHNIAHNIAVGS